MAPNTDNNRGDSPCEQEWFYLPFVNDQIQVDAAGARQVAWLACRMAVENSGALETDKAYAIRMAAFITGYMAAQCGSDERRVRIFQEFSPRVDQYLNRICSNCGDEKTCEKDIDALVGF